MNDSNDHPALKIKKYSNRRFYDTTRSCHVTLRAMHDLICEGHELSITDGKSGDDITNMVLTQIILERDPPKLSMFPTNVLHQVIRTQRQFLGSVVEQFFAQVLGSHKASQEQWHRFIRNTLGVTPTMPTNPMDWTRSMMEAFTASARTAPRSAPDPEPEPEPESASDDEMDALRRQVEELTMQVRNMSDPRREK